MNSRTASPWNFFHVFAFQWKHGTTPAQVERARKEILAFQGVIPGLMQTHVWPNTALIIKSTSAKQRPRHSGPTFDAAPVTTTKDI
jgi:hypothetical protein